MLNMLLAYLLGMAVVLGIWLVLILGSYLLWQALGRWSTRRMSTAMAHPEPVDRPGFG